MGYNELFRQAKRELSMADHIMSVTVSFVRDTKIYFNVIEHARNAILMAMKSFLLMKKEQKEIRIIPSSDELIRQLFFETYMDSLGFSEIDEKIIDEMEYILNAHKKSQADLKRGREYVIVLPTYDTVTVNIDQIKKYLKEARELINKTEKGMM